MISLIIAIRYNGNRSDRYMKLCDGKAIRYNRNRQDRYVTVTVPDRKSKRHENLSGIVET